MALPGALPHRIVQVRTVAKSYYARRQRMAMMFLIPMLLLNVIVILGPAVGGVALSFTQWSGLGPVKIIGLENFGRLFSDRLYVTAFVNNLKWMSLFLTIPVLMGLVGAALLAPIRRGQMIYRLGFFIPYVIASVVNTQIWRNILHPTMGIGAILAEHGFTAFDLSFFGDRHIVLYSIAFTDMWHWWGFLVVVYLAAMQAIDPELIEVARIEGASRWQEFWYVTLPGIRPTLVFTLLMTVISSILAFDYVWIMTQGGPANASHLLATATYHYAFQRFEVGYAASIGVTMSLICAGVLLGIGHLRRRGWEI
jgi:raffinose/stachyose/melibiose transport system permease protein